jgi:hypothetical protein
VLVWLIAALLAVGAPSASAQGVDDPPDAADTPTTSAPADPGDPGDPPDERPAEEPAPEELPDAGAGPAPQSATCSDPAGLVGAPPDAPCPSPTQPQAPPPQAGPTHFAAVQQATTVKAKSVTTIITVPPHLGGTFTISVRTGSDTNPVVFGNATYNDATGNSFVYDWPLGDGANRDEVVWVDLTEAGQSYSFIRHNIPVNPLWDVTQSPLAVKLNTDCDGEYLGWYPSSEPDVGWVDDRGHHNRELSLSAGESTTMPEFARTLTAVGTPGGPKLPVFHFWENDTDPFSFHSDPSGDSSSNPPVLPRPASGTTHAHHHLVAGNDGFCTVEVDYDVTATLRTYTTL